MAGAQAPVVVFWYEWGIHVMVVLSFLVQVTLLLLADIRRRKDWPVLKGIIWSGYTVADTLAVYALGHMSVLSRLSEHHLMALWAPLLLVHLGGQDNITAYAIEDNRLWLRHLQTFGVQVLGAAYVLYVSSIFSLPTMLRWATIMMSVVGVLKYGERVWSLWSADEYASSSLSARSYKDFHVEQEGTAPRSGRRFDPSDDMVGIIAHSLLDVPKEMFKGPTRFVKINRSAKTFTAEYMSRVVEMQLWMMYDLLYTKAAVIHTAYGVCIRIISLPLTVAALLMIHAMRLRGEDVVYRGRDVTVTIVLLTGAVVLEAMSVLRAVFSTWTAALLWGWKWDKLALTFASAERRITSTVKRVYGSEAYWSGNIRQQGIFNVLYHTDYRRGSKIAAWIGREDWWDSMFYSSSIPVLKPIIDKVLEQVSTTNDGEVGHMSRAQGLNAVRQANGKELVTLIEGFNLELADSILVWHIATAVYTSWYIVHKGRETTAHYVYESRDLSEYMFFLLAARPYMLPYPVTRHSYVQLCHDSVNHLKCCSAGELKDAILDQKDALMKQKPLKPDPKRGIIGVSSPVTSATSSDQASINKTFDKACQLAATLIPGPDGNADGIMEMIFQVWLEMLCYTAYGCDEKSHAENLTNGGDIMTITALLIVYMSNGFIAKSNLMAPTQANTDIVPPIQITNTTTGAASTSSGGEIEEAGSMYVPPNWGTCSY